MNIIKSISMAFQPLPNYVEIIFRQISTPAHLGSNLAHFPIELSQNRTYINLIGNISSVFNILKKTPSTNSHDYLRRHLKNNILIQILG